MRHTNGNRWPTVLLVAVVAGVLITNVGCIVLPIPNTRVEGSGLKSRVVDADSGRPVAGARVFSTYDDRNATVDAAGRFELPPHVQWHFGYLAGVLDYPIWPFTGDVLLPGCSVRVEAPGYPTAEYAVNGYDRGAVKPDGNDGGVLSVPQLALHARTLAKPSSGPATRLVAATPPAG